MKREERSLARDELFIEKISRMRIRRRTRNVSHL